MFEVKDANIPALHIVSEPGDATHYDYYVHKHYDDYYFFSIQNSFEYPTKISKWSVPEDDISHQRVRSLGIDSEFPEIMGMAEESGCNPWTMLECLRTIQFIEKRGIEI